MKLGVELQCEMVGPIPPLFRYAGGKRRVADLVWRALGNVHSYIEPFAGSAAVLFGRPAEHLVSDGKRLVYETINDKSGRLVNIYRALRMAPDEVWLHAQGPRTTIDLTARQGALKSAQDTLTWELCNDPDFFDSKLAGWQLYALRYATHPRAALDQTRNVIGRPDTSSPQLTRDDIREASERLTVTRLMILCNDWRNSVTPALLRPGSSWGIFFDPPYASHKRRDDLYGKGDDGRDAARGCRAWAIKYGRDPRFRIVLCGYADEGCPRGWSEYAWSSASGDSRHEERIWFSPFCHEVPGKVVP